MAPTFNPSSERYILTEFDNSNKSVYTKYMKLLSEIPAYLFSRERVYESFNGIFMEHLSLSHVHLIVRDDARALAKAIFDGEISVNSIEENSGKSMVALLSYLDAQPHKSYVIIFDDLKRFARDRDFHWVLRRELAARKAIPKCLNFNFEDTPEGEFIETIMAAQGHLEREQNRRQVIQKMKARVENGYWVFTAPKGYKHVPDRENGGKKLVQEEPLASTICTALEGFATGRFASQAEVRRFLEADPYFPKDRKDGSVRAMTITRLLKKVVYAGYVEAPKWGVSVRKGKHEGLISFEQFERIQDILDGKKRMMPERVDYDEDFPLRGFVVY